MMYYALSEVKGMDIKMNNMKNKITYVFPGQGSQYVGMGKELFEAFPELIRMADEILGYSIKELCLEDPDGNLHNTQYTQPALYIVNALSYLKKIGETGQMPDYVAGHSLGEYNALFAAGVIDFASGLRLVKKRGELMANAKGGGMAAVIGFSEEDVRNVIVENGLRTIDIANLNSPKQIVIAGPKEDILLAKECFEKAGCRMFSVLNVSGAFHSRYMKTAQDEFETYINEFQFNAPKVTLISNLTARPCTLSSLKYNVINQMTHSVRWTDTVCYLMGLDENMIIEQVGPGNVMTGLVSRIKKEATPVVVFEQKGKKLGNAEFKKDFGLEYACIAGAMYKGISSKEIVINMARSGMLGVFGSGGVAISEVEKNIIAIKEAIGNDKSYGMNILYNPQNSEGEERLVDLYLEYGVSIIEASAYMTMTRALVRYRLKGIRPLQTGEYAINNKIIGKVSRPEIAKLFMEPAPEKIVTQLVEDGIITPEIAAYAKHVPMADAITVEADSAGHTDQGVAYALMPAMISIRDRIMKEYSYSKQIKIGAAGGIGTPEAAAAAFMMGADYITTGSINQCTIEANTSDVVKDMLEMAKVQDMEYCPAGDMFELGAKVQVLRLGTFFPARANKLYELYKIYDSYDEIDEKQKKQIEEKYFGKSFEDVYEDVKKFYDEETIRKAEEKPKVKMALIFRWYFGHSTRLALSGDVSGKVNFQIHCGPALGALNEWLKGTELESWRNRKVADISIKLLDETYNLMEKQLEEIFN